MSKKVKIYEYKNCDSCKKALKYLDRKNVAYDKIPILESPPSIQELKTMLSSLKAQGGSIKNLFNTSGEMYRELKISDRLKEGLTEEEALQLLSKNGKLIKRPFLIGEGLCIVGFKEDIWNSKKFKF